MRSAAYPFNVYLATESNFEIYVDGVQVMKGRTMSGTIDIMPIIRDYVNSSKIVLPENIGSTLTLVNSNLAAGVSVTVVDDTTERIDINTNPDASYSVSGMVVANDYNWRAEDIMSQNPIRLTSVIVNNKIDLRQLIFMSAIQSQGSQLSFSFQLVSDFYSTIMPVTGEYTATFSIRPQNNDNNYTLYLNGAGGSLWDTQKFTSIDQHCQKYAIYAVNRQGGITSCLFDGRSTESATMIPFDITTSYDPANGLSREIRRIQTEGKRRWSLNSGAIKQEFANDMIDILTSPRIWLHDLMTDRIFSVNCIDGSLDKKNKINTPRQIINYTMTFEEARINIRK